MNAEVIVNVKAAKKLSIALKRRQLPARAGIESAYELRSPDVRFCHRILNMRCPNDTAKRCRER